ncbi:30S ribosomal protein S20 [bacterium]|nr:30S ribosomal protein S20 [bacterium]
MPRIKSSILDVRKNHKQREINRIGISKLKTAVKKVATAEGDAKKTALNQAYKVIDKAVQSGLLPKKTGARKKSRISRTKKAPVSA